MDPFLDLIRLLRPQATLWARIDAAGRWGVSFRKHDDLLFCWVEQGDCLLTRPDIEPVTLQAGDFALVRTSTPFTLTSDPSHEPEDSETIVATTGKTAMRLGDNTGPCTVLRGGRFVFDTANEEMLTALLPPLVHVSAGDNSSERLHTLLSLNESESSKPGPGSGFVIARLMDLILVEILRSEVLQLRPAQSGLFAGLADPVLAVALSAMHEHTAKAWTVGELARRCGTSRSAFATRFRTTVGVGPIEYLQRWRLAVAKDELRRTNRSVSEIALAIGFQSGSAFSTAFTRAVGCSPSRYAHLSTAKA